MYKEETELLDSENQYISFYDVVINLTTNKHYLVVPYPRSETPCLARINLRNGKPTGKLRFPLTYDNSQEYKIIGNRGIVNE